MSEATLEIQPSHQIPDYLVSQVQSKLAYVDETIISALVTPQGDRIHLDLSHPVEQDHQIAIEAKVQRVVTAMVKGAFKPKVEVLEDFMDRPTSYHNDPMAALQESGEVFREEVGMFTLGPTVAMLAGYFERRFQDLATTFNAKPFRFPTLMSAHYLDRVKYFSAFPHSLSFATHLREDLDVIDEFAEHAAAEPDGLNIPSDSFGRVKALLSPAVCNHLYFYLADRPLPDENFVATAVGKCFRYEAINLTSLERLWDFTMQEVIFVGAKDFVLDNRQVAIKRVRKIFAELGLAYRVESANDPFFIGEFRAQTAFQSAFQLKYEIRAKVPHRDGTLAIGSYNYHQNFFGRQLNITLADGSPVHTGCVAFGLERVAYAFIAQFGLDPTGWPQAVREAIA
jgi:seryl-tRNA synthetase